MLRINAKLHEEFLRSLSLNDTRALHLHLKHRILRSVESTEFRLIISSQAWFEDCIRRKKSISKAKI
jgi:hypothetical protein